jgi:hypothetical protein
MKKSLLGIVRRIGEYSGVEPSRDPIAACNDDTVFPSFQELVVKESHPLGMHELPGAVSHELFTWFLPSCSLPCSKILEVPRKLLDE